MRKGLLFLSIVLFIVGVVGTFFFTDLWLYANKPASANSDEFIIQVKSGRPFNATTNLLHEAGLIQSPFRFNLIARIKGYDKRLQAGEYLLSGSMSPLKILEKLVKGEVKLYKLTIPEGYNMFQIAELVAEAGFAEKTDFLKSATDAPFVREKGIQAESLRAGRLSLALLHGYQACLGLILSTTRVYLQHHVIPLRCSHSGICCHQEVPAGFAW